MAIIDFINASDFESVIFDDLPISLWIEDFSYSRSKIRDLRQTGIHDIRRYIDSHPEFVKDCIQHTEILAVNKESVRLTHADDRNELLGSLTRHMNDVSLPVFKEELLLLADNRSSMERELPAITMEGTPLTIDFRASRYESPEGRTMLLISMQDITRRVEAENRLKASLLEKDVLLKEIHHRVKNNLAMVNSLIQIFGSQKNWQDVDEITSRIHAISRVHQTIYNSDDPSRVNFRTYLQGIISSLEELYSDETSSVILEEYPFEPYFNLNTAIPLGLIITELIINARKHAFADQKEPGIIRISLERKGNSYILVVSDNGIGMGDLNSIDTSAHLGITLVRALVEQIQGKLEFISKGGTTCIVSFPAASPDSNM